MLRWDLRVALRALSLAALALLLAWLLTAATDEGGIAWGVRAGRTLPVAPACAALGTLLALIPARSRGEVRALEALGRRPWRSAAGAAAGGAAVALGAALALGSVATIDVSGFYPVAARVTELRYDGSGFVDPAHGVRVGADGALTPSPASEPIVAAPSSIPPRGRLAAAVATAVAGLALPLLAAHVLLARPLEGERPRALGRGSAVRAVGLVVLVAAVTIVLFHAAAVLRVPAWLPVVPMGALLLVVLVRYGATSSRWS